MSNISMPREDPFKLFFIKLNKISSRPSISVNTFRPINGRHFAHKILKYIYWKGLVLWFYCKVPWDPINSRSALVQIMAWCRTCNKPIHEPTMTQFNNIFICFTRGLFTNISSAFQNNLAKIYNARNHIYGANVKLKLCTCAQTIVLGSRTKFQLEIILRSMIF